MQMDWDRSLTIRLLSDTYRELEEIAETEGSSVSAIVRRAIYRELERQRGVLERAKKKRKKK